MNHVEEIKKLIAKLDGYGLTPQERDAIQHEIEQIKRDLKFWEDKKIKK